MNTSDIQPDLDARLPAADPYEPVDLGGADTDLMERILAEPPVDPALLVKARRARRSRAAARTRLAISLATAAAVVGVLAAPAVLEQLGTDDAPRAGLAAEPEGPVTQVRYVAAAVEVARANPRVLVTADGWKVRHLAGFEPDQGDITFQRGPDRWTEGSDATGSWRINEAPSLDVTWYPRSSHRDYHEDREGEQHREISLWGGTALLVTYGEDDHAVLLEPEGDVFLELRGQNVGGEAAFLRLLEDDVERVDVETWLGALPPEAVTVEGKAAAVDRILADVPVPPGFDPDAIGGFEALDSYQMGATVTGAVTCAWGDAWSNARAAGDDQGAQHAAAQLATSHEWAVLHEMDAEGDFPGVVWEVADTVAAGVVPEGLEGALGCG